MKLTDQIRADKKAAGFTFAVICTVPVNGWEIGDVMKFTKKEKYARSHAAVKTHKAQVSPLGE